MREGMEQFQNMVIISENGASLPIIFPVGADGFAAVSTLRLCVRFQLRYGSMHVDEDIYDSEFGILTHNVGQVPSLVGDNMLWTLKLGRYRAYGISNGVESNFPLMRAMP